MAVPDRDAAGESIRNQFDEITRSRKLEGMWWGDGGAWFVASYARNEDGSAAQHDGQVWFLDPARDERGRTFFFARNDDAEENSEFTGPNFSFDRKWLVANIQDPGIVFAITGPWTGNGRK